MQRRLPDSPLSSPYLQRRNNTTPERRWRSPSGSPLSRNYLQPDTEQQYPPGSTSPILLQRFYHQQRQQQQQRDAEEKDYGERKVCSCKGNLKTNCI